MCVSLSNLKLLLRKDGIYTIDNFLNDDEIELYNNMVINPPKEATDFTDTGLFTNCKWHNKYIADLFFDKLEKYIVKSDLAIRANNLIMAGSYKPGEEFSLHTDTGLFFDIINKQKSKWTLLIYLNDDFEGGETTFYDYSWNITEVIKPVKGKALLFDMDLWHRGNAVLSGNKRWIGCEIIGIMNECVEQFL
jgi:hypothetical protein